MRFDVVTLFPELVRPVVECGIAGRAAEQGLFELHLWNPRRWGSGVHQAVDDRPYGGGPGMVMGFEPLSAALSAVREADPRPVHVVALSPQGRRLDQAALRRFAGMPRLALLCGRYEGIDERLLEAEVDEEWSLGDYVLSGGELAAMVVIDGCVRLLPGALGHADSAQQDSFTDGLLDCPHYTRPEVVAGRAVPQELLTGHHARIERWRRRAALGRTWERRPDLLAEMTLGPDDAALLDDYRTLRNRSGEHRDGDD